MYSNFLEFVTNTTSDGGPRLGIVGVTEQKGREAFFLEILFQYKNNVITTLINNFLQISVS
jgi:hypothetical protein